MEMVVGRFPSIPRKLKYYRLAEPYPQLLKELPSYLFSCISFGFYNNLWTFLLYQPEISPFHQNILFSKVWTESGQGPALLTGPLDPIIYSTHKSDNQFPMGMVFTAAICIEYWPCTDVDHKVPKSHYLVPASQNPFNTCCAHFTDEETGSEGQSGLLYITHWGTGG